GRHLNAVLESLLLVVVERDAVAGRGKRLIAAVRAVRALVDLGSERIPLGGRHAPRARPHAVAAADAAILVVGHRPVVLPGESLGRTGRRAGWFQAVQAPAHGERVVHAPLRLVVHQLVEGDERVGLRAERGRVLESQRVLEHRRLAVAIVPLLARDLARAAADALGDVDERRSHGSRGGRCRRHDRLPSRSDTVFSRLRSLTMLTRQALVSWVPAPGSAASIVRWLTLAPVDSPWKPQLYGIQTTVTSWSPILSAFMRGVTSALTSSSPRADDTLTQSPDVSPSFCASVTGSSSMGSGTSSLSHGMFRVVEPAHQCSATVDVIST